MRLISALLLIFFITDNCRAQQPTYTAFTVNDGLPSNYVYRCVEDDHGFLWIATDAGIARFDGRRFQVFTTKDGLPDNEVLAVVKENDGRIWVNCFKQSPAYFDEVQNRFINAGEDSDLAKVKEGTTLMYMYPLAWGGILFVNEQGNYIFRNKKLVLYSRKKSFLFKENDDGTQLVWSGGSFNKASGTNQSVIYQQKGEDSIDSLYIGYGADNHHLVAGIDDGKLYNFSLDNGKCFVYSNFSTHPLHCATDSLSIPEPFYFFGFTNNWLSFYAGSGKIYVFDKRTLKLQSVFDGNYLPNTLYNDSKGNIWVGTIDKGLLVYNKGRFNNIAMPPGFTNTNFLSIARKTDGTLLAGNYYGQILETNGTAFSIHHIFKQLKGISRQRKILVSHNKVFTFSEGGTYINYTKRIKTPVSAYFYAKTAIQYNDSIIMVGHINGLQKLNTITNQVTLLYASKKRVTALASADNGMVYFGSTDGLFKYYYDKDTWQAFDHTEPLFRERVMALCTTHDSLLWVATSGNGVAVVKNNKVLLHLTEKEGIINNSSRSIMAAGPGQVWLGTAGGISVINYTLRHDKVGYTIQNLSVIDGLTNNVINEMLYQNDTVYAATADGISVIPANTVIPKFNIPIQLIRVNINGRDTAITTKYELGYKQENIQIQFAGVELSGHFKNLQYTLDENKSWVNLNENTLTLRLNSGNHFIKVRAVDVNGNISDKVLAVQFNIATPFWKDLWFWVMAALGLQLAIFFMVSRWLKKKREAKLAKEIAGVQTAALEQQAFTSLMNPHFLFNALNSIQHYINVQDRKNANRYLSDFASLIRKNFEAAQQSFIPLEQEIENIKIYLRLEQMRFNDRFTYTVVVDEALDLEEWMIPTMMLQPFLENALLHGIMPSSIDGRVDIGVKEQNKNLIITITDNGIGIANSRALKENARYKSRGMELIKKRIAALGRFGLTPITIHITPPFEDEKNPGNKIILCIPLGLYDAWLQARQQ